MLPDPLGIRCKGRLPVQARSLSLMLALSLVGCSGAASPIGGVASVTPGALESVGVTPAATPLVFESTLYPYALSLPAGVAYQEWTPATRPWHLADSIFRGSYSNDEAPTVAGALFILGAPWSRTLREFEALVLAKLAKSHDCERPVIREKVTLASEPAMGLTQVCAGNLVFTRVVALHAGVALVINLGAVAQSKQATALDELLGWLTLLTWTK
jgi:hypothetical protein